MKTTWVLIANGERARCFERHASDHSLTELTDFVHPHTRPTDTADKGHGRTGHAGTQFEPHTEAQAKARGNFARQLADYLNTGVATQQCSTLILLAPSPMLGELKPHLSPAVQNVLTHSVASDLTQFSGPDLKTHLDRALQRPD